MKKILQGLGVSHGRVKARVKIIRNVGDYNNFEEDNILVTKITDPTMIMLINKASGIICDIGGITSHPSTVSRELGIPCIVATKNATSKLKDGQIVEMNGKTGGIYVLD